MYTLGYSGLKSAPAFRKATIETLSPEEYRFAPGFDSAAALLKDGEIVACAEEERFNGEKHTPEFPINAINYCLQEADITISEVDRICHSFNHAKFVSFYNRDAYNQQYYDEALNPNLQLQILNSHWPNHDFTHQFFPIEHHLAHAASAFYPSGYREGLVVVCDGLGELNSISVYHGKNNQLFPLKNFNMFSSIGMLYSVVTQHLGFLPNDDEYKVMGLAPYGDPSRYAKVFKQCVRLHDEGEIFISGFIKNRNYIDHYTYRQFRQWLTEKTIKPRLPNEEIQQEHKDLAAALQETLNYSMIHLLTYWQNKTNLKNFCYAGGVALNCATNGVIFKSNLFENTYIQPAASDSGSALGAALYDYYSLNKRAKFKHIKELPFYGPRPQPSQQLIEEMTSKHDIRYVYLDEDTMIEKAVELLTKGKIIAWVQGRMEFGPRALGNRSILADPRDPTMRDKVNQLIKQRELFRPFAPSIKKDKAHIYYDIPKNKDFPYMLTVMPIREKYRAKLPAITHFNCSSRIQTVSKTQHEKFWKLLDAFEKSTGYPILLNTSFNIKDQPIVCSTQQAIDTFTKTNLDALFIDNIMFFKPDQKQDEKIKLNNLYFIDDTTLTKLKEWNKTYSNYPRDKTVQQLFEEQASRFPKHIAVEYESKKITYKDLNEKANQLARFIKKQGIKQESPIAICIDRGINMIVSILAIIKADAAYVPIDPEYPATRIQQIIENSATTMIITKQLYYNKLKNSLKFLREAPNIMSIDINWLKIEKEKRTNLKHLGNINSAAYILYTSGTTGNPKGVCCEHRGIIRLVKQTNYISFNPGDRVAQTTHCCFDMFNLEMWGSLLNGGTLICTTSKTLLSREKFANFLQSKKINILWLTTSLFNFFASKKPGIFKNLDYLIVGGEALNPTTISHVINCKTGHPKFILNGYGPTENSMLTTVYQIPTSMPHDRPIPIGKPISNTYVYVLDSHMKPVPIGVTGELYTGGDGIARCYYNDPRATSQSFLKDPFSNKPGARIYKTGDLVRWLPDGNLDYIGRVDNQVKMHGVRVELEAIEEALQKHPKISLYCVTLKTNEQNKVYIAAYLVPRNNKIVLNFKEIRDFLSQRLPKQAIPSAFMQLDHLPLTPNGKTNKEALPNIRLNTRKPIANPPGTPSETKIALLWTDLLGIELIDVNDDFYELGGNSILALQLKSMLDRQFPKPLPLETFYKLNTVKKLAEFYAQTNSVISLSPLVTLQPYGNKKPLFFIHGIGGEVFCFINLQKHIDKDRPVHCLRDPSFQLGQIMFLNLKEMAQYYTEAIKKIQPRGPYYLCGLSSGGIIAYEIAKQLTKDDSVNFLGMLDTYPIQPKEIQNEFYFRNFMTNRFNNIDNQLRWIDLSWQRFQLILKYKLLSTHTPITLFKADNINELYASMDAPDNHFGEVVDNPLTIITVPGNHDTILVPPNLQVLAKHLNSILNELDKADAVIELATA